MNRFPVIAMLSVLVVAGCQPNAAYRGTQPEPIASPTAAGAETAPPTPANLSEITQSDPCATRMHDLSGALLTYYMVNRQLPAKLSDLEPLADANQRLELTCPLSHLQYVYVPHGLRAEGKSKAIILHDAAASHDGTRWCILMPDALTQTVRSLEVVQLPESIFRLYH